MDIPESFLAILEAVSQGIHVVDLRGVTVVYNKAASLIDGLSPKEVLGKNVLSVFPSLDSHTSTLLRVLRRGIPELDKQQTFTNYKGKKITTVNSTYPVMRSGAMVGACEVSTDVTRLREMSERILDLGRDLRARSGQSNVTKTLFTFSDIIGESAAMRESKRIAMSVAESDVGVVVWGETGTGKELLVQAIHSASSRRTGPFVPQNCAAMPEGLLEGLMFGTSRGGFTGAVDRPGLMELAAGGTLYLDEIDSMPLGLQVKLLRAIQDKRVRRVGETKERAVDVRFIASTGRSPQEAVRAGTLRSDLYFRLAVVEIGLPPLRRRHEDIPLLCDHFLHKHSPVQGNDSSTSFNKSVSPQVMAAFLAYDWPGNVRELEHAIEGSLVLSRGPLVEVRDLPPAVRGIGQTAATYMAPAIGPDDWKSRLRTEEEATIKLALERGKTVAEAARILGIPRQTLQYRMKVLKIRKEK